MEATRKRKRDIIGQKDHKNIINQYHKHSKKTETHSKLTSQSWSTECAKFSFGPALHFQKWNYMYTHLKLKISLEILQL